MKNFKVRLPLIFVCLFFFSAVTNEVPEQPVISPLSGAIFERRIIEKYILENGCDPVNGKDLKVEELIEIKSKFSRADTECFSVIVQILIFI